LGRSPLPNAALQDDDSALTSELRAVPRKHLAEHAKAADLEAVLPVAVCAQTGLPFSIRHTAGADRKLPLPTSFGSCPPYGSTRRSTDPYKGVRLAG
jgi:hypothetical protein